MKNIIVNKNLVLGIIFLMVGASVVSALNTNLSLNSKPIGRGNWFYVGGSGPGNYTTIQSAIDAANSGDTIFVYGGIYNENIVINTNNITLKGEDKITTIIDACAGSNTLVIDSCSNVLIEGFSFRNASGSDYEGNGIKIFANTANCTYNLISDCLAYNNSRDGVQIFINQGMTAMNNKVIHCDLFKNKCGFEFGQCDHSSNYDNQIWYSRCYNNTLIGIGISWTFWCTSFIVSNCEVYNNGAEGIHLNGYGGKILNTSSHHNGGDGLNIFNANNGLIVNCTFYDNFHAGINSSYVPNNCSIYHNNIFDNNQNAIDLFTDKWYNASIKEGNYWSDYTGIDANGDGIGDTPYNIPGGDNQDLYPFMEPNGWLNRRPVANFTYTIDELSVTFNASSSYDLDGDITTWDWEFGDSHTGTGQTVTHNYPASGTYNVILVVVDDDGDFDYIIKEITVEKYQKAFIFGKITNLTSQGEYIQFEAVKTRVITFSPFSFNTYASGEQFTISKDYQGWVGTRFILALCDIFI